MILTEEIIETLSRFHSFDEHIQVHYTSNVVISLTIILLFQSKIFQKRNHHLDNHCHDVIRLYRIDQINSEQLGMYIERCCVVCLHGRSEKETLVEEKDRMC